MTERFRIQEKQLAAVFEALKKDGRRVLAPRSTSGRVEIGEVSGPGDVAKDYVQSATSAKSVVFPKVERLLTYTMAGKDVAIDDAAPSPQPTVLFGVRPCEARAFAALDAVFNWDSRDVFFNARTERLAVVSIACTQADQACFCTSLGAGPDDPRGSDILLTSLSGGGYAADVLTDKGTAIALLAKAAFEPLGDAKTEPLAAVAKSFESARLTEALGKKWDDPIWAEQSLRCLGCGACAFVCPTCVCFDIQDEADADKGQRLRCWDSCGMRMFTLHASGHNPREQQSQRWRQRVYHKFSYYPERFNMLGCVGCGKCTRACPVDMNLKEHLTEATKVS
jgi:ferredoxin